MNIINEDIQLIGFEIGSIGLIRKARKIEHNDFEEYLFGLLRNERQPHLGVTYIWRSHDIIYLDNGFSTTLSGVMAIPKDGEPFFLQRNIKEDEFTKVFNVNSPVLSELLSFDNDTTDWSYSAFSKKLYVKYGNH